jgi:hypothetical protein
MTLIDYYRSSNTRLGEEARSIGGPVRCPNRGLKGLKVFFPFLPLFLFFGHGREGFDLKRVQHQ